MKKILFAALVVLLLTAVCVVGLVPALSNDNTGTLTADEMLTAYGAAVDADAVKARIEGSKATAPAGAVAVDTAEKWAAMAEGGVYKLTADIDLTKAEYASLNKNVTVYGDGHTVTTKVPLFGTVETLTVYDLTVAGTVAGNGAVAGKATTVTLTNVVNTANVTAENGATGGLVGEAATIVVNGAMNLGAVNGGKGVAGGIVGNVTVAATLEYCVNGDGTNGAVSADYTLGGIVGVIESADVNAATKIQNCCNYAALTTTATAEETAVGGIVGEINALNIDILDCTNHGAITGPGVANSKMSNGIGGIAGRAEGALSSIYIKNCLNMGVITATYVAENAHYNGVAGILGYSLSKKTEIYDSMNAGTIRAKGGTVNAGMGGMLGQIGSEAEKTRTGYELTIKGCTNVATIGGGRPGGILGVGEYFNGVALIEDCTNKGAITSPKNYAGGMAARLEPLMEATEAVPNPITFKNCVNEGNITANGNCAGGIYAYGTGKASAMKFENCVNKGNVYNMHAGGISANTACEIVVIGCSNSGDIYATGGGYSGGITGNSSGKATFTNCYNEGDIIANSNADSLGQLTGGICGRMFGTSTFTNCVNDGDVIGGNNQTGGICGEVDDAAVFIDCTNNGNVTASVNDAAGIVARAYPDHEGTMPHLTFTNCVNTGDILSVARYAGGILGWGSREGTFTNCVNTGNVKGKISVGGIAGVNSWKITAISCINTGYVEGGRQVGGIVGSACSDGHHNGVFTGCVSIGSVYNNALEANHNGNSNDKGNATGGIVGYVWGIADITHCTVTANVSASYSKDMGADIQNHQPVGAFAGYQNNNEAKYLYNTFTGTLDGGEKGETVLIKSNVGSQMCNRTIVAWNYSVNAYPFFIEKHDDAYYLVEYSNDGKSSGHNDLAYTGWHVTADTVANGLLATLNEAAGGETPAFVQVEKCGFNAPVYSETAALLTAYYEGEHSYDQLVTDELEHWYECECGEIAPEGKNWHSFDKLCANDASHWYECECGATTESVEHLFETYYNNAYHWTECACGAATAKVAHTLVPTYTQYQHWDYCDCGYEGEGEAHDFTQLVSLDAIYHAYACECGAVDTAKVTHGGQGNTTLEVTDAGHRSICICGTPVSESYTAHIPESDKIYTDGEYHWNLCICDYVLNKEAHYCDTAASCDTKQVCELCEVEFGEVDPTNHEQEIQWTTDATGHYGWYPCCGYEIGTATDYVAHSWVDLQDGNVQCEICKMICVHEGGDATCVLLAVCDHCGRGYGEVEEDDHRHNESDATCIAVAVCADCGVHYGEVDLSNHDASCAPEYILTVGQEATHHTYRHSACLQEIVEGSGEHVVGTVADCNSKAHCSVCDLDYGEIDLSNHDALCGVDNVNWLLTDYENERTHHKGTYSICGVAYEEEGHNFVGGVCTICNFNCVATGCVGDGTETCQQLAKCIYCGLECGELGDHDMDLVNWVVDETAGTHYHKCLTANCVYREDEAAHSYDATTGKCTVCDYTCAHGTESDDYDYDFVSAQQHSKTCKVCGLTVNEAHAESTAATCIAPAWCDLCGSSYGDANVDAHDFATTWTFVEFYEYTPEGGEPVTVAVHYYACSRCSAQSEFGLCDGEATCKDKAECSVCGNERGEIAPEHTGLATEWTQEVMEGVTYHYHYCADCETKVDPVACEGTAATCAAKSVCATCENEFGELDPDNHATADQTWMLDAENDQHYKVWNCCPEVEVDGSRAAHVYDAVTFTCECGYACPHNGEFTYTDKTDGTHDKICPDCGYTEVLEHVFDTAWEHAVNLMSEPFHFHACVCGARTDEAACTIVDATCQTPDTCSVCNETYGAPVADAHIWGDYTSVDTATHNRTCTVANCGTVETAEAHEFGSDVVCDKCSYTCDHAMNDWSDWTNADEMQHQRSCNNCGYVEKADHSFDMENWGGDGDQHWRDCLYCTATTQNADHHYDRYKFDDNNHWMVCVCGDVDDGYTPAAHAPEFDFDESGHWTECVCGKITEAVDHSFEVLSDADGHWDECECGATRGAKIKHTYDPETGICTATGCGYACPHTATKTYVADADIATVHDVYCNECGAKSAENEAHSFDFSDPHYVCEGEYHYLACLCGAKFDAENGAIEHSTGAAGDRVATCTSKAYCSICKAEYGTVDPNNHATPNEFDYWTDPEDLTRHIKAYACCGVEVTNEAHTYESGVCKFCDADCTHTGGTANCKDKAICKICGVAYGELTTSHTFSNACDTDCNACGITRETAHIWGDWVETLAPTTTSKGKEERTCTVCGAIDTFSSDMLPEEEEDHTTVIVVAVVAGSVVSVGAIAGIGIWIAKSRAAAKLAAEIKPWRTKKYRKKKWKKRK